MQQQKRINRFAEAFPHETSAMCTQMLCTNDSSDPLHTHALAWQTAHRIEVDMELVRYWGARYSPAPSQACLVVDLSAASPALRSARDLWRRSHAAELIELERYNKLAVPSLFYTMFRSQRDRAQAAVQLLYLSPYSTTAAPASTSSILATTSTAFLHCPYAENQSFLRNLISSAKEWASDEANKTALADEKEHQEKVAIAQFLFLYGATLPTHYQLSTVQPSIVTAWNQSLSCNHLTFSEDGLTVSRSGYLAYAVAVANVASRRCTIRIQIDHARNHFRHFSFGLILTKSVASCRSCCVGASEGTWGITNAGLEAGGVPVRSWVQVQPGDILVATIDTFEVRLNIFTGMRRKIERSCKVVDMYSCTFLRARRGEVCERKLE